MKKYHFSLKEVQNALDMPSTWCRCSFPHNIEIELFMLGGLGPSCAN